MYSTMTKEIICMMEDDNLHENMIDFCRSQYANNRHVLNLIDEFDRDYALYSPITWYTRDGFLYKMLNKALRINDIKPLVLLHNYIRHLHQQLIELQQQSIQKEPLILYRGQQMPIVEFEKIKNNIGGLLSISNFLSTTAIVDVAGIFAGHPLDDQTISCILFQIYIDPTVNTFPVANIERYSYFGEGEKEYLFSMGSVFRIEKVQQRDEQVWLVHLTLTSDNDSMLAELKESLKSNILDQNPLLMFGGLLIQIGEYEKGEYFYLIGLTMESEPSRLVTIWNQLGIIYSHLNQIDEAQKCYVELLQIKQKYLDKDDPALATIYNNIGTIYHNQGNSQLALEHFQRALSIHLANPESNYEYIAAEYCNIAAIFIDQGNLQEAFQCQQRSLDINRKYLPSNHPYLAQSYYALAMSLYALGRYDEMFEYMQKALSIDKQSLPPNHPQTQFHEENMKAVVQRMFERIAAGSIIIDDS
ncbi:unnamed protein product [Rotaria sordida]|uniref:Tetratricopeptide repeat protein n=1 Tax=Rotaria sordida TaxID=392033 RepID=A0A816AR60_9BILA|nr:unnamed protein product [Rotaria sordida]CAF1599025.1 unnamed protein product [Rotaria sordida]